MKISATFLDEISHDIPHQNWGPEEWDKDFLAMKNIGINTVVMIRCGYKKWQAFPSEVLTTSEQCFPPPLDLVDLFLTLAEKYNMDFYFGTYDSGIYWHQGEPQKEVDLSIRVVDEFWAKYGQRPAMKGWYISLEISRNTQSMIDIYAKLGRHCKDTSGGLPVLISPWIQGVKAIHSSSKQLTQDDNILSVAQHEKEWDNIIKGIKGAVDIVAFQDGQVDFDDLEDYLTINKILAEKHGLRCWTNIESFDRDMPIKYFPIKWEKMLFKLNVAKRVGIEKAITFEFPHFMSPNSCYHQAHGLYRRYCEWIENS